MVGPAHLPSERQGFYSFDASVPIFVLVFYTYVTPPREERDGSVVVILFVAGRWVLLAGRWSLAVGRFFPCSKSVLLSTGVIAAAITGRRVVAGRGGSMCPVTS